MSPDQAKTKWCPLTRHENGENRVGDATKYGITSLPWNKCVAEDCMMWVDDGLVIYGGTDEHPLKRVEGHCGLTR